MNELEMTSKFLAESMIAILVVDLEYDYQPVYGIHPIRHQMAWINAEKILGKNRVEELVKQLKNDVAKGHNYAVKTNPTKSMEI